LSLLDALSLCELLAKRDPARYERAALRWLERFIDERAPRVRARSWKKSVSFAIACETYSSLSYMSTCEAPSIQNSSFGSRASSNASRLKRAVSASVPWISSSGRGAIRMDERVGVVLGVLADAAEDPPVLRARVLRARRPVVVVRLAEHAPRRALLRLLLGLGNEALEPMGYANPSVRLLGCIQGSVRRGVRVAGSGSGGFEPDEVWAMPGRGWSQAERAMRPMRVVVLDVVLNIDAQDALELSAACDQEPSQLRCTRTHQTNLRTPRHRISSSRAVRDPMGAQRLPG
jgi:hypothetical protein